MNYPAANHGVSTTRQQHETKYRVIITG